MCFVVVTVVVEEVTFVVKLVDVTGVEVTTGSFGAVMCIENFPSHDLLSYKENVHFKPISTSTSSFISGQKAIYTSAGLTYSNCGLSSDRENSLFSILSGPKSVFTSLVIEPSDQ